MVHDCSRDALNQHSLIYVHPTVIARGVAVTGRQTAIEDVSSGFVRVVDSPGPSALAVSESMASVDSILGSWMAVSSSDFVANSSRGSYACCCGGDC